MNRIINAAVSRYTTLVDSFILRSAERMNNRGYKSGITSDEWVLEFA